MNKNKLDGQYTLEGLCEGLLIDWINLPKINGDMTPIEEKKFREVLQRTSALIREDILERDKKISFEDAVDEARIVIQVLFDVLPIRMPIEELLQTDNYKDIHPKIQGLLKMIYRLINFNKDLED